MADEKRMVQGTEGIRRVLHCDLDCFFAAVEVLDNPALAGKPVVVGGDPNGRGVVSTANYVARRYGVHSAMSAAHARRLCPQAVFLRPRFSRYSELSGTAMAILDEYFTVRERVSIDEAYGELSPGVPGCRPAEAIAREIKARVRSETGLTISIGAARTKSAAKIASDLSKPDGCLVVRPGTERDFLRPLPVERLSGVGPHTRERLERFGVVTVGQLADFDPHELQRRFGKHGAWLWQLANGRDDRPVVSDHGPPKSVSRENTYARDLASVELAIERVRDLATDVARTARREQLVGRTVNLKVKWSNFQVLTRQRSLTVPTGEPDAIAHAAVDLLLTEIAPLVEAGGAIRLLGVGLSGIVPPDGEPRSAGPVQLRLFESATDGTVVAMHESRRVS
jgi:DNA polymerase-4